MGQKDQKIEHLERTLDDQSELVRNMALGMRMVWMELQKDEPDIARSLDILDDYYPGHKGSLAKALSSKRKSRK